MRRALTSFLLMALLSSPTVAAQQASIQTESSSYAAAKPLVTLYVVATDNHGNPVGDLTGDDFKVYDQGKLQRIGFYCHSCDPPASLSGDAGTKPTLQALPSGPPVVVLLDFLNLARPDQDVVVADMMREAAVLKSTASLYLYILTPAGTVYPVHALPESDAEIQSSASWTEQMGSLVDNAVKEVSGLKIIGAGRAVVPGQNLQTSEITIATYRALETLTTKLNPLSGRKNIVWITGSMPVPVPGNSPLFYQIMNKTDQANITVNFMLRSGGSVNPAGVGRFDEFAGLTGGRAYTEMGKAIGEAMNASKSYYVIQYPAPAADTKLHEVKVTTDRKGVRLRAKQAYYPDLCAQGGCFKAP